MKPMLVLNKNFFSSSLQHSLASDEKGSAHLLWQEYENDQTGSQEFSIDTSWHLLQVEASRVEFRKTFFCFECKFQWGSISILWLIQKLGHTWPPRSILRECLKNFKTRKELIFSQHLPIVKQRGVQIQKIHWVVTEKDPDVTSVWNVTQVLDTVGAKKTTHRSASAQTHLTRGLFCFS